MSWVGPGRSRSSEYDGPGPTHDIGGEAHETRAPYGPARHFRELARGFDGPGHGLAHVLLLQGEGIWADVFCCCSSVSRLF